MWPDCGGYSMSLGRVDSRRAVSCGWRSLAVRERVRASTASRCCGVRSASLDWERASSAWRRSSACCWRALMAGTARSEEHTSELQSHFNLVFRLLLEKKKYM